MAVRKSLFHVQRATLKVALFFISLSLVASSSVETYKDIIEKAYNLSLQRDRLQATNVLVGALRKESKKAAQKELIQALDQVATVFYSDKAQQLYELALSMKASDAQMGMSKLQEASRLEPDNLSIEMAIARQNIQNNECDAALSRLIKYKELNRHMDDLKLVVSQAFVCVGKFEEYLDLKTSYDPRKSTRDSFWSSLEAEYLMKVGSFTKALEVTQALQKSDADFPEGYYWQWKVESHQKVKSEKAGQKYLSLCKGLNSRLQRAYLWEPQLCHRTVEVETFLKKNNNPEI
ncbi:MAG: hypothetical protein COT73_10875 [Bdellovibrio sp. CG10_big_fil_rev_8_21_14_0_10_47_8]|nr:MAG: hypothetical protein COT73_10875 [Bdellovibrio sp. CG10_big_fil_rev_8_21_14_0_10_47_8]